MGGRASTPVSRPTCTSTPPTSRPASRGTTSSARSPSRRRGRTSTRCAAPARPWRWRATTSPVRRVPRRPRRGGPRSAARGLLPRDGQRRGRRGGERDGVPPAERAADGRRGRHRPERPRVHAHRDRGRARRPPRRRRHRVPERGAQRRYARGAVARGAPRILRVSQPRRPRSRPGAIRGRRCPHEVLRGRLESAMATAANGACIRQSVATAVAAISEVTEDLFRTGHEHARYRPPQRVLRTSRGQLTRTGPGCHADSAGLAQNVHRVLLSHSTVTPRAATQVARSRHSSP
jgi:hypothetical protein